MRRSPILVAVFSLALLAILATATFVGVRVLGTSTRPNTNELREWGLTNGARGVYNRRVLTHDTLLGTCARAHSQQMADRGRIYHSSEGQLRRCAEGRYSSLGENVGVGGSLYQVARAFWGSPSHRRNITDPAYRAVGVGVVYKNGSYWITQFFAG
jgi:uncharacterized protein YkwD